MSVTRAAAGMLVSVLGVLAGCGSGPGVSCTPGEREPCACTGGTSFQVCRESGSAFGRCRCDLGFTTDAAVVDAGPTLDAAPPPMCTVTVVARCAGGDGGVGFDAGTVSLGCGDDPSAYYAVCHCANGKQATSVCGSPMTCNERCAQGSCVPGATLDNLCLGDGAGCTNYGCECCSGLCSYHRCHASCMTVGQACRFTEECCSGNCVSGRCACASTGGSCANNTLDEPFQNGNYDCCSGVCSGAGCQCGQVNNNCSTSADCCAGLTCSPSTRNCR